MADNSTTQKHVSYAVMEETLKAMDRLSKRTQALEDEVRVLRAAMPGYEERIANLEKAFQTAFTEAEEKLRQFAEQLAESEENSEAEVVGE